MVSANKTADFNTEQTPLPPNKVSRDTGLHDIHQQRPNMSGVTHVEHHSTQDETNPSAEFKTPSPVKMGNKSSSTKAKLRRNVSVDDDREDVQAVRRLVEYFIVVSSQPRWENRSKNIPATPELNRADQRRTAVATPETVPTTTFTESCKKLKSLKLFRKRETSGSVLAINASYSHDSQDVESRDEIMPPPKPRGTWSREDAPTPEAPHRAKYAGGSEHTFQPKITARYPLDDHEDNPLNPMVTHFCFPGGDVIAPSETYHLPRVHHFVLTNEKGRKVYGTCLTIYEEYLPSADAPWLRQDMVHGDSGEKDIEVTVDSRVSALYLPRALCVLSIWPYATAFREYLAQLYRLASSTNVMTAPIERYIMNLCMEIPAPPPGAYEVQLSILDSVIRFWAPPAKLPIAYVALPYQTLFDCLDIDNILHLWYCLCMERKVLLLSSQHSILTVCAEILCSLLFPMQWSHLYVPLLPKFLCQILDAPTPFLVGVTRENWLNVQQFVNEETIVVDLDRNSVMFGKATPELPPLPGKKWTKLQKKLEQLAGHLFWKTRGLENEYEQFLSDKLNPWSFKRIGRQKGDPRWNEKLETFDRAFNLQFTPDSENLVDDEAVEREQSQWDKLQETFLRFFVSLFKDYRKFLHTPDADTPLSPQPGTNNWLRWSKRRWFDREGFIASQQPDLYASLSELCMTQQFDDFITRRLYSPEMPDIKFFDQSIDAKLNRSRLKLKKVDTPLLQSAKAHKVLKIFQAVEPNTTDLPEDCEYVTKAPLMYKTWPETFDSRLFCKPRPIPMMITAEFDRQAALVSRLRKHQSPAIDKSVELLDLYGSDYDHSPESMAFTVFFFTYAAVIGREWQEYKLKQQELDLLCLKNTVSSPEKKEERDDAGNNNQNYQLQSAGEANFKAESFESTREVVSDLSLGICDACPNRAASVSDAVIYVSTQSPGCPQYLNEINSQAQVAYDTISKLAQAPFEDLQKQRQSSLLDSDDVFAEYEEARDVATAQLDLAFETLKTMEIRGLVKDPDLFKSLMRACGRCGDAPRALELIEMMKTDGLAADKQVLSCFMAAFSNDEGQPIGSSPIKDDFINRQNSDAYSTFLRKKFEAVGGDSTTATTLTGVLSSSDEEALSDFLSDSSASEPSVSSKGEKPQLGNHILEWLTPHKKRKKRRRRRRRKKSSTADPRHVTDRLMKQIILGESLLDFLYPDLDIDASGDSCPQCSHLMQEKDIIAGWEPCEFQDYTTCCPKCKHRFVPRFSVMSSVPTFEGSQGPGTPLYCEFLSPWVLRKELNHVVTAEGGIEMMLKPEWRSGTDIRATLWWNLIALCNRYRLPFSFLLQGSFQNRLINPCPED